MPSDSRFRPASILVLPITHLFPVLAILMMAILPLVTVLVLARPSGNRALYLWYLRRGKDDTNVQCTSDTNFGNDPNG